MIGNHLEPFKFWCQKVLPNVYDDSLSYYEYLCKLNEYLNEVIGQINTLTDNMEDYESDLSAQWTAYKNALNAEWAETKTYIDNYFNNLDVQQEINNKLDQMAQSGALSTLLAPIVGTQIGGVVAQQIDGTVAQQIDGSVGRQIDASVNNQIAEPVATATATWLSEHIEPTTPAVDNSLSVSGAAGDALSCGNALDALVYEYVGRNGSRNKTDSVSYSSSYFEYSDTTIVANKKILISIKVTSDINTTIRVGAVKPNHSAWLKTNIITKDVTANTPAILTGIYTTTAETEIALNTPSENVANLSTEMYVYDITNINIDDKINTNYFYDDGFAYNSLNAYNSDVSSITNSNLIKAKEYEKHIVNDSTSSYTFTEYTEWEIGHTYLFKLSSSNAIQSNANVIGFLTSSYTWAKTFGYTEKFIDGSGYVICTPPSNADTSKSPCVMTNETYILDVNVEIWDITNNDNIGKLIGTYGEDITLLDYNDYLSDKATLNNAKTISTMKASKITTVVSTPAYYKSLGYYECQNNEKYLFTLSNIVGISDDAHAIGFMNSSSSWARTYGLTKKLSNGSAYVLCDVPATADLTKSPYVVLNNIDNVDMTVGIYNVTGLTLKEDEKDMITLYGDTVNFHELVSTLSSDDLSNSWYNKNVLFIGDSLTAANKYQYTVKNKLGINFSNKAIAGAGIKAIIDNVSDSDVTGVDLIVMYFGYNDRAKNVGNVGDLYPTNNTICGLMQYAINRIYTLLASANNLTCKILIVSLDCAGKYPYIDADGYTEYPTGSGQTMETIAIKQIAVANANSLPCVDLWHDSGINKNTWTVFGAESSAVVDPSTHPDTPYPSNGDQLHKSNAGYQRIGECITGTIIERYGN